MRRLNQRGSFTVFLTLSFALLGTFIGFAIDFGHAYLEKARISRLVDAAALAAAKALQGQTAFEDAATRAACDSMVMNGAPVVMSGSTTCAATSGATFSATLRFFDQAVQGGPPIKHVEVRGDEPMPTTFLRFLGWMVPSGTGDFSTINVAALAQAAPERPVDLVLILDRSGSMTAIDGSGQQKIKSLKTAVNAFLSNNFTGNDRIGMVSFATRGCGNTSGADNKAAVTCTADVALTSATSATITMLQTRVNGLVAANFTNTMEAFRTARATIAPVFNDATRASTRKVVLLVTDGKPTAIRLDTDPQCHRDPKTGALFPGTAGTSPTFTSGCILTATGNPIGRDTLSLSGSTGIGSGATGTTLFLDTIACIRSLHTCDTATGGTQNGAMYEADLTRNCGTNNPGCTAGGEHDVLVFAIGIGQLDPSPSSSFDRNAKCLLARIANATDIVNTGLGTIDSITTICKNPPDILTDGDKYLDLQKSWPCATGPCINDTQEKGKVYVVDMKGNVLTQLQQVFAEIAAILKLRLTL